jgi:hypothetical protein
MKNRNLQILKISTFTFISVALVIGTAMPSNAASGRVATGKSGLSLTVSKSILLNPNGADIAVSGKGFSTTAGIYVALCVKVKAGVKPSPCGGGADMTGATGASIWLSTNPPSYGIGVARPIATDGSFKVKLRVAAMIGNVDCRTTKCAIYARADHLRSEDRSADIAFPVTFAKTGTQVAPYTPEPVAVPVNSLSDTVITAKTTDGLELKTGGQPPMLSIAKPLTFSVVVSSGVAPVVTIDSTNTKGNCSVATSGSNYLLTAVDGTVCTVKITSSASTTYKSAEKLLPFVVIP